MPGARQGFNRRGYDEAFGREAKRMWESSMIIGTNEDDTKALKNAEREEDSDESDDDEEND